MVFSVALKAEELEHRGRLLSTMKQDTTKVRLLLEDASLYTSPVLLSLISPWLRPLLSSCNLAEVVISVPELSGDAVSKALYMCQSLNVDAVRNNRGALRVVNEVLFRNDHLKALLELDEEENDEFSNDENVLDVESSEEELESQVLLSETSSRELSDSTLEANFSDQQARLVCLVCYKIFGSDQYQTFREHLFNHEHRALKKISITTINANENKDTRNKSVQNNLQASSTSCTTPLATFAEKTRRELSVNQRLPLKRSKRSLKDGRNRRKLAINKGAVHKCDECDAQFGSRQALLAHNRFFHFPRPFRCHNCHKEFSTDYHLTKHLSSCNKSLICFICNKSFSDQYRLKQHLRMVHEGLRQFECPYCHKSFGEKRTLNEHLLTHGPSRLYECKCCKKGFVQKNHLKNHLASAHNQGEHPCDQCEKTFAFPAQLAKHVNKVHNHVT